MTVAKLLDFRAASLDRGSRYDGVDFSFFLLLSSSINRQSPTLYAWHVLATALLSARRQDA